MTVFTVFDFSTGVFEIAAAFVTQKIKGAKTKQTIKIVFVRRRMARKIFTLTITEKFIAVFHY